ncbi:MAG: glycosyltransferase [Bacteroidales bacterium]|nr:glycosyltransferase [Bacteroidales bacterium]
MSLSRCKKKQLFFAIHYLELGGAEMSLIGLLGALDYTEYDVDLFVYSHRGELMDAIPPQVHLLPEIPEYAQIERPMKEVLKAGYLRIVLARLRAKCAFARYQKKTHPTDGSAVFAFVAKLVTPLLPAVNPDKEYDLAVSFLAPHDIVLEKVRARKKVCWVHTDYSKVDVNVELELPVWSGYDRIAAVSEAVSAAFTSRFPTLKDKMVIRPNILPENLIRERAKAFDATPEMPAEEGVLRLLSIGRFTEAKNFDNVPDICRRILRSGVSVRWYLIGYGGDEALIRRKIQEAGMGEHVILLGKKANPYPYILACDWYVQPSRYEGSPVTIQEARFLGKPVIATTFPTVHSVIRDGADGFIVPMDNEGCASGIAALLKTK